MADVGDEVLADRLDPPLPGAVVDQDQDQAAAQRGNPGDDMTRASAGLAEHQLGLPDLPVPTHLPDQLEQFADADPGVPHQSHGVRGRAGFEDLVCKAHHQRRGPQH